MFSVAPVAPRLVARHVCSQKGDRGVGILPSSQSYGKIMYMDPLEVGCTVWVNIGSCLSCVIALGV